MSCSAITLNYFNNNRSVVLTQGGYFFFISSMTTLTVIRTITYVSNKITSDIIYTPFHKGAETAAAVPLRYYYITIVYRGQYTYCTIYRVQVC